MGIEQERGEQYDPTEVAIAEQQGYVELSHIAAIRAVIEDGSKPSTHPLRKGRIRPAALEVVE